MAWIKKGGYAAFDKAWGYNQLRGNYFGGFSLLPLTVALVDIFSHTQESLLDFCSGYSYFHSMFLLFIHAESTLYGWLSQPSQDIG